MLRALVWRSTAAEQWGRRDVKCILLLHSTAVTCCYLLFLLCWRGSGGLRPVLWPCPRPCPAPLGFLFGFGSASGLAFWAFLAHGEIALSGPLIALASQHAVSCCCWSGRRLLSARNVPRISAPSGVIANTAPKILLSGDHPSAWRSKTHSSPLGFGCAKLAEGGLPTAKWPKILLFERVFWGRASRGGRARQAVGAALRRPHPLCQT